MRETLLHRLRFAALVLLLCGPVSSSAAADRDVFLKSYCTDCHGSFVQEGNFRVDRLTGEFENPDAFRQGVKMFDRVDQREMPPRDADQPTAAERKVFLTALRTELVEADRARLAKEGRPQVRRLNRVEYEDTLRDLLALPLLRVKESLPEDGQEHGFDKVAGALDISHIQMKKYMDVADVALQQAIVRQTTAPETKTWREPAAQQDTGRAAIAIHAGVPVTAGKLAPGLTSVVRGNPVDDPGNTYRAAVFRGEADSVLILSNRFGAHQPQGLQPDRFRPPVGGFYRVRFSIWSARWERDKIAPAIRGKIRKYIEFGEPWEPDEQQRWKGKRLAEKRVQELSENIEFYGETEATHVVRASLKGEPIGFFSVPSMKPTVHEFTIWLEPGEKVSFHPMTLPQTAARNSASSNGVRSYEGPGIAFDWFEMEGPLVEAWPPKSHRRLFGDVPIGTDLRTVGHARSLLRDFADRAFRRPVVPAEMEPYTAIVAARLDRGDDFESALRAGCKAILCSPDFLFVGLEDGFPDPSSDASHAPRTEYALASRLSYFLWNSMPDETLRELARRGELSRPDVLRAQVERMLADRRSERFVEHFLDEWLEMKKIDFTTPDPQLYPEFDEWLRDAMLAETRAWFRKLLDDNLGVRSLIDADVVVINQRLAELYDIRGVNGAELREVPLPADSPRGGFLTQAAVLKVTANGTATSPVLRGVWIVERLLGVHLDPPPPDIPAVEPDATGAVSIREMIEKHRADVTCASCHRKMDPPGLALESFDVIGGWREQYRISGRPKRIKVDGQKVLEPHIEVLTSRGSKATLRVGPKVDASGELADGRRFDDVQGLKTLLLSNEASLARNMARQFVIYSTGSGVRFSDRGEIDRIASRARREKYGLRSILQEVVQSDQFRRAVLAPVQSQ